MKTWDDLFLTITIRKNARDVERYAADELKKYLSSLYDIDAKLRYFSNTCMDRPAIMIGHPESYPVFMNIEWPDLSNDGFCLKTVRSDPDQLVVLGASGRGVLFGVYDLLERWGMRFLLSGDVFPEYPKPIRLNGLDECREPSYPMRAIRPMANLPEGSAAWDLSDFTRFIDQMAKLKYNTFIFNIMESGPWLDYEYRGVKRPAGDIFYGYRFPIDDDFIGKELFIDQTEFYSPVLAKARDEEERKKLGIDLVRSIIAHCKLRDMQTLLQFALLEPPTEIKHRCNEWATSPLLDPNEFKNAHFSITPVEEFGINPDYAAWMNVSDPVIKELTAHRLASLSKTYLEADFIHLWVSEHRASVMDCSEIFRTLDEKYHLMPEFNWEKTLQEYASSPFDRERYQNQIKADLLFLSALDEILNQENSFEFPVKSDIALGIAGVTPQLAPIVMKILPPESAFAQFLDYGVHGPADRLAQLMPLMNSQVPTTLEIGIHDDNNMYFPQANVESLEQIIKATAHTGVQGYATALWQVRQSDISATYLGRASWQPKLTASQFYQDFFPSLLGAQAAEKFEQAYRIIEAADRRIRGSLLYGYAFLMTEKLIRTFIFDGVDREEIKCIRPQFQSALDLLNLARPKASRNGLPYVDFWLKRTQFAVEWLDMIIACSDVGHMLQCKCNSDPVHPHEKKSTILAAMDGLLMRAQSLIELIIGDAKDVCDLGQIANLNQHLYRYLRKLRDAYNDNELQLR